MEQVATVFAGFFLITFFVMIIGLISPKLVVRWGKKKTRKDVLKIYGLISVAFFILMGVLNPGEESEKVATAPERDKTERIDIAISENPIIIEIKKDPDFNELMEIDEHTTPFKENKKWIISIYNY